MKIDINHSISTTNPKTVQNSTSPVVASAGSATPIIASYEGDLPIGDTSLKCAVLDDSTRVLTRATFVKAMGRQGKVKGGRAYDDEFNTPVFLTAKNLEPFISKEGSGQAQ
ncbi:hypothetical protein B1R32_11499 [Abditibacterium utsteinense]|uniref:Uncharacterized protein n=1 Tax=Abditibacterium utsteinense TaxID=1960156 RepID=A0A2S8SR47_9BACT|nr:hypothetical protein [Abditibacterium utsteinense]PQV63273.1 hypothetical protein B1R32_11499 [Abditibacterium utsteinense]